MQKVFSLGISLACTFAAGYIGTLFTTPAIDGWYADITKPYLNPPNWIFGPVWTVLYILMAVAAWKVWEKESGTNPKNARYTLGVYGVHLVINTLWSIVFFGLANPALALVVILVLLGLIAYCAWLFYRIDITAGLLFIPYIMWVSFATYLNASIMLLN